VRDEDGNGRIDPDGDFAMPALVGGLVGMASYAIQSGYHFSWSGMGDAFAWGMISAVTLASGGISGGLTSMMTGGDFWAGAKTGLIVAGLNHTVHLIASNKPEVYKSPVKDNLGKRNGECVLRCLEEFAESYGIEGFDFDKWYELNGSKLGVHPNSVNGLVNSSNIFASTDMAVNYIKNDFSAIIDAFINNQRVMAGFNTQTGGHAVMVSKIKIWPSGKYNIYFAETSPERIGPYRSSNIQADFSGNIRFYNFRPK